MYVECRFGWNIHTDALTAECNYNSTKELAASQQCSIHRHSMRERNRYRPLVSPRHTQALRDTHAHTHRIQLYRYWSIKSIVFYFNIMYNIFALMFCININVVMVTFILLQVWLLCLNDVEIIKNLTNIFASHNGPHSAHKYPSFI